MDRPGYAASFEPVSRLGCALRERMVSLYLSCYDGSSAALFLDDLAGKDEVLLLRCAGTLVGFSTLRTYERDWQQRRIRVVYSGDTIVDPAHWGQQALAFAWIERMGELKRERPDLPMYWFLLVKGHRTFRYLPAFARSFHPHWNAARPDLERLAHALAAERFADAYNAHTGVVEFAQSHGHLKPQIASPSPQELRRADVHFFLERNPGYRRGHELVCMCELEEANLKPLAVRLFRKGARRG